MLATILCLVGIAAIVFSSEVLWNKKILRGEWMRKYVHILSATFIATWPWLVSYRTIEILSLVLLTGALYNHFRPHIHMLGEVPRKSAGDICFALAPLACALLTHVDIFFAIAMLHVAFADGLAALFGIRYGSKMKYKILGQTKSVIGTMTFWIVSTWILGVGLLLANDFLTFHAYVMLIIFLPPLLSLIENTAVYGLDNIAVPIAVVLMLDLART